VAVGGRALPDAPTGHDGWFWGLIALTVVYSLACITRTIPWERAPIGRHAIAVVALQPLVCAALYLTGGADAYMGPMLVLPMLYVAYFFPAHYAWPLVSLFALVYATPLLYDGTAIEKAYPARTLGFVVAMVGETLAMQLLKRRLLRAEARQRVMAERDPLTGLYNRRTFDAVLQSALDDPEGAALVLFDFDLFKVINDAYGHPVGDAVLCAIATACADIVRDGDCLARIGGDEFAVIARRAGSAGVARIVAALERAIAHAALPDEVASVRASFAWAVAPIDATTSRELLDVADQRLLYRKRLNKTAF
jgi:diguanylate cyclase (GGDEF)-like protein